MQNSRNPMTPKLIKIRQKNSNVRESVYIIKELNDIPTETPRVKKPCQVPTSIIIFF